VTLDQDPELVVEGEAGGAEGTVAPPLAQPALGGREERAGRLRVVLALEETEQPPAVPVELVEVPIDVGADSSHRPAVPPGEEVLGLAVLEERVPRAVEEAAPLEPERGDPARLVTIDPLWQPDEPRQVPARADGTDFRDHGAPP
jgi:hypothetical protein